MAEAGPDRRSEMPSLEEMKKMCKVTVQNPSEAHTRKVNIIGRANSHRTVVATDRIPRGYYVGEFHPITTIESDVRDVGRLTSYWALLFSEEVRRLATVDEAAGRSVVRLMSELYPRDVGLEDVCEDLNRYVKWVHSKMHACRLLRSPGKMALYYFVSFLNHSCDPNAILVDYGDGPLGVIAIRDVEVGGELTISYNPNAYIRDRRQRKEFVWKTLGFECACAACSSELGVLIRERPTIDTVRKCSLCAKPATTKCSKCCVVSYCSKDCQKKEWKVHLHSCQFLTEMNAMNLVGPEY
jgi:hypothetical protein